MTPHPGQPATGSQDSTSSTRPDGACVTATRWRRGKSSRTSHRSQRSSASGHTQLWLGIVEVLEISGGRSPLIIEDLDVYTQLPRTTGAPTLNSEEPVNSSSSVHVTTSDLNLSVVTLFAYRWLGRPCSAP